MKFKRLIAAIAAAALLSGCAADHTAENDRNRGTENSSKTENASNYSEDAAQSIIDSIKDPFDKPGQDKEPEEERILLTDEELKNISLFYPLLMLQSESLSFDVPEFDLTSSIKKTEELDIALKMLRFIVADDDADSSELIEDVLTNINIYSFSPETMEKTIRKYFLPSFEIKDVDYTKSEYWNRSNNTFELMGFVRAGGDGIERYHIESGYKKGDCYYLTFVSIADYAYKNQIYDGFDLKLSQISDEYFDFPRGQLKVKKFTAADRYLPLAYNSLDDRPDYMKKASDFFKENNLSSLETVKTFNSIDFPDDREFFAGVMNGVSGKRMYFGCFHYIYVNTGTSEINLETYGTRGKNDKMTFEYSNSGIMAMHGFSNVTSKNITDHFSSETYTYKFSSKTQYNGNGVEDSTISESCALNNSEISKDRFDSAPVISYFSDDRTNNCVKDPVLQIEHTPDEMTLNDYYELCKALFE